MEPITYKETTPISLSEYCPSRKIPLSAHEILIQQVKREDEINHADDGLRIEIPKYVEKKVRHPNWVKNFIKGTLGQLMP